MRLSSFLRSTALVLVVTAATVGGERVDARARPLAGRETLARAYEAILDARFDEAARSLAACEGAPREACLVLDAARLWWQIQLDPHQRGRDDELERRVERAIAAAEAWTARAPGEAEGWFYLGGAYGVRVQWRVLRQQRLAAARDGKHIKESLERALDLDSGLEDANFGIGLYRYYADIAPTIAKIVRWLLFLPGGDRAEGLERMLRTRELGQLLQGEADYQLHIIYLWYEHDLDKAIVLLKGLIRRYPGNPLFLLSLGDIEDVYLHDPTSSARTYERALELAREGRLNERALAQTRARLGLATHLDTLFESDRALEHARAVIAARATAPYSALAEAWLLAGRALARLGHDEEAAQAFAQADGLAPPDDPLEVRRRVREARRQRVDSNEAEAYRLALTGWRAYERGGTADADTTLARALAMNPSDMVTRYRYAEVLAARGKTDQAFRELDVVTGSGATTPPTVFADACVALAPLVAARGDAVRAIQLYERAARTFGASAATRAAAARAAARLRASGAR